MIQTSTFALSKDIARLPFGMGGRQHYYYLGDVRAQWETSHSSAKALELIGTQSLPADNLPAVREWLGPLTAEEQRFVQDATKFLRNVSKLISTLPTAVDPTTDIYETILDARLLAHHVKFPCRVLDIGAGAARHLLNLFLRPGHHGSAYCAIDSIGLPYLLQNLVAAGLAIMEPAVSVAEAVDYEFARQSLTMPERPEPNSIWHLPLWHGDKLPDRAFDLILCNYVLDEVPAEDFQQIVRLIGRCLAPDGVVYCRGGQQKSMFRNLYLFGYGTYHQQDITAALLAQGLKVKGCELLTATMTRVFARAESTTHHCASSGYAGFTSDKPLIEAMQKDFVHANIARIKERNLRTVIWSDPGHVVVKQYLSDLFGEIRLSGITNDHIMHRAPSLFGIPECRLQDIAGLNPQAIIIAGTRSKLAVRELTDHLKPVKLGPVTSFNYPIAFCYM